jgi:RNA polymerase sigma factor (sigma-70 family)
MPPITAKFLRSSDGAASPGRRSYLADRWTDVTRRVGCLPERPECQPVCRGNQRLREFETQSFGVRPRTWGLRSDPESARLAADQSSPSQKAVHNEQCLRLADALAELPEPQQEAVVLHSWQNWTVADIGRHMGKSPMAVAGLLKRGLQQLRTRSDTRE